MSEYRYGRKRNGIIRELNKKVDSWVSSVKDNDVKKIILENGLITGGSIASMLLGEKINDFDIYFKTRQAAKVVAEYYAGQCGLEGKVYLDEIKNIHGVVEERVIIGVTREGIQHSQDEDDKDYKVSFVSPNAITLTNKIQIVIRFFGDADKIHENYDFAHCMCSYDINKRKLHLPPDALEALLARTLFYKGSLYPIASIFRMKKFVERGWRVGAGELLKIMWQISELDLTDKNIMSEQLTGVDLAYLGMLIEAIKDLDPEKLTSKYVIEVIDRIFGGSDYIDEMQEDV